MNSKDVISLLEQLDTELALLKRSEESLNLMKLSGHQTEISVRVGDRTFNLTYQDRSTGWMSTLIRGREMLMLGAKKLVSAEVDYRREQVADARRKISELLGALA